MNFEPSFGLDVYLLPSSSPGTSMGLFQLIRILPEEVLRVFLQKKKMMYREREG
jgi:hypothetical protein